MPAHGDALKGWLTVGVNAYGDQIPVIVRRHREQEFGLVRIFLESPTPHRTALQGFMCFILVASELVPSPYKKKKQFEVLHEVP